LENFFVRNPAALCDAGVKAVPGEQTQRVPPCGTAPRDSLQLKETNHETLTKITLAVALLATAATSRAEWVNGYYRSYSTPVAPHVRQQHRHRQPELSRLRHDSRAVLSH